MATQKAELRWIMNHRAFVCSYGDMLPETGRAWLTVGVLSNRLRKTERSHIHVTHFFLALSHRRIADQNSTKIHHDYVYYLYHNCVVVGFYSFSFSLDNSKDNARSQIWTYWTPLYIWKGVNETHIGFKKQIIYSTRTSFGLNLSSLATIKFHIKSWLTVDRDIVSINLTYRRHYEIPILHPLNS